MYNVINKFYLPFLTLGSIAFAFAGCASRLESMQVNSVPPRSTQGPVNPTLATPNSVAPRISSSEAPMVITEDNKIVSAEIEPPASPSIIPATDPVPERVSKATMRDATSTKSGLGSWTAIGGSPMTVARGETLESLSTRYGVPPSAIMTANGLSTPLQVHEGAHLIIPVYNARSG